MSKACAARRRKRNDDRGNSDGLSASLSPVLSLVKDEPRHKAGQQIVSALIVRISYLARTFLGLTRIMKQIFLAFKNEPQEPI